MEEPKLSHNWHVMCVIKYSAREMEGYCRRGMSREFYWYHHDKAPSNCNKCDKTSNQPSTTWKHKLGHGFSSNSHHGSEFSGGTAAADNGCHTEAKAATPTPTTIEHDDVPAHEFEHVKDEERETSSRLTKNQYKRKKNKLLKQKTNVLFNNSD